MLDHPHFDPAHIMRSKKPIDKEKPYVFAGKMLDDGKLVILKYQAGSYVRPPRHLGTYEDASGTYSVERYCGNNVLFLLNAIVRAHPDGLMSKATLIQIYVWSLNMMRVLKKFHHKTRLIHLDIKMGNVTINAIGRPYLIDCGGAVAEGEAIPPNTTTLVFALRDAISGAPIARASKQHDLRGLAFIILRLILHNYTRTAIRNIHTAITDLDKATNTTRAARIQELMAHYRGVFAVTTDILSYQPFIACARKLANEADTSPRKLKSCYTELKNSFRDFLGEGLLPPTVEGMYISENPFYKAPRIASNLCCSIS